MNENFLGAFLLAEDAGAAILLDLLNATYVGDGNERKTRKESLLENNVYMNRKQRIADAVEDKFYEQRRVSVAAR